MFVKIVYKSLDKKRMNLSKCENLKKSQKNSKKYLTIEKRCGIIVELSQRRELSEGSEVDH